MPRPEGAGDIAVILAALVGIANQQGNWRAGGSALEDPGENLHFVRFAPLGDMP